MRRLTKSYLADINLWVALVFDGHRHHQAAKEWFQTIGRNELWFCRFSQLGLLRLLTNEAVMGPAVKTQTGAWEVYDALLLDKRVGFLTEPLLIEDALRTFTRGQLPANKAWSDAYLAAVAVSHGMTIATFDRAIGKLGAPARILGG